MSEDSPDRGRAVHERFRRCVSHHKACDCREFMLAQRIDELEAALRWYSNENNWCDTFDDDASTHLLSSSPAEDDGGHRARVALGEEK